VSARGKPRFPFAIKKPSPEGREGFLKCEISE
jgi:hypothetical protein